LAAIKREVLPSGSHFMQTKEPFHWISSEGGRST